MKVQFYGSLGDGIAREIDFAVPDGGCTVAELRRALAETYPHAASELARSSTRAVVDEAIAREAQRVRPDDRVAFFPPLSGG